MSGRQAAYVVQQMMMRMVKPVYVLLGLEWLLTACSEAPAPNISSEPFQAVQGLKDTPVMDGQALLKLQTGSEVESRVRVDGLLVRTVLMLNPAELVR